MNKIAQKRGPLTKLRELVNVPTEKVMETLSPQFIGLMDQLRETDDTVRELTTGLKGLLKLAKTNFNRKEYMTAIYFMGQFHEKAEAINEEFKKFITSVNIKHHEFLFNDVDPDSIKYLTEKLGPKFKNKKSNVLGKTAGFSDWWHNITDDRGRALSAWEKRFPKEYKELKRQISNMITRSESLLSVLLTTLKLLSSYRATRKLEDYLKTSEKFKQKYDSYNSMFSEFYNKYIDKFIEMRKAEQLLNDKEPNTVPMNTLKMNNVEELKARNPIINVVPQEGGGPVFPNLKEFEIPISPKDTITLSPDELIEQKKIVDQTKQSRQAHNIIEIEPRTSVAPTVPAATIPSEVHTIDTVPEDIEVEETMRSPALPTPKEKPIQVSVVEPEKKSHKKFLDQLSKMGKPNNLILSIKLSNYADEIKDTDSEMSQKLKQLSSKLLAE